MNNLLEQFFNYGKNIRMTNQEKNAMRSRLVRHAETHPKGIRSTYFFRFAMTGAFAVLFFLASGGFMTAAAQKSLPGEFLYPVKRASESVKKVTLSSSTHKANYELNLIEKRFTEAQDLLSEKKLNPETETIITNSIKTHTENIQKEATKIAKINPAEALAYNNKLADIIDTKTEILLAAATPTAEETALSIEPVQPTRIVLAAHETVQKINEKQQVLEEIVLSDTNIAIIKTAEEKFTSILAMADNRPELFTSATSAAQPTQSLFALRSTAIIESVTSTPQMSGSIVSIENTSATSATPIKSIPLVPLTKEVRTPFTLLAKIKQAYEQEQFGQVVILAEQIEQMIRNIDRANEKTEAEKQEPKEPETITKESESSLPKKDIDTVIELKNSEEKNQSTSATQSIIKNTIDRAVAPVVSELKKIQ